MKQAVCRGIKGGLSERMRLLLTAATAPFWLACVNTVSDEGVEEQIGEHAAELKNGTIIDGTGASRGAVGIRLWSPLWNEWQVCSGQIVSKRTIMTAAHCVIRASATSAGTPPNPGTAQIVVWRASPTSSHVPVLTQTTVTALYNDRYLETASTPFDVGLFVSPVDLQNVTSGDAGVLAKGTVTNVSMRAFGFGYYNDGPLFYDDTGRSGTVFPTFAPKAVEYFYEATASQPQICKQDSGGPLKSSTSGQLLVYGIASRHTGAGTYCRPIGHWATTAHNMAWLKGKISGTCTETSSTYSCW